MYKNEINPLVLKLAKVCNKHNIPWLVNFFVNGESCTSADVGGKFGGSDRQHLALGVLCPENPIALANAEKVVFNSLMQDAEKAVEKEGNPTEELKDLMQYGGGACPPVPEPKQFTANLAECGCEICTREFDEPKAKTPPPEPPKSLGDVLEN